MWQDWIYTSWTAIGMTTVSIAVVYAAIILYTRVFGLRSFSKMSSFDFAMTIAIGSLFATTIATPSPPLLLSLVCFGLLFLGQKSISLARGRAAMQQAVDNSPILLMAHGEILHENLRRANVTEDDLRGKLREANVLDYHEVKAVVFETTGDVSVMRGDAGRSLNPDLLRGVRDAERHFG